jgi:protein-tyrosine phosphatase
MSNYHELVKGKVYIGGADTIKAAVEEQGITEVFDLRDDGKQSESFPQGVTRHHYPIVEDKSNQIDSIKYAIDAVMSVVKSDKKVYFHCSGGRNRTGTIATALLIELGETETLDDAEQLAKKRRPDILIKSEMRDALKSIYPNLK